MVYKRQQVIAYIIDNLAFSSTSISQENVIGLFDSNRVAQGFFCSLFDKIFGYKNLKELDKLNGIVNYPAIDIADKEARIAFQITTDSSSAKIKDTIVKFNNNRLYEDYDRLVVLIIGNKINYTTTFDTESKFTFDKANDIWDDSDLARAINNIDDMDSLNDIQEFLKNELLEYKFPERLFPQDIKKCIEKLLEGISDLLDEVLDQPNLPPNREEGFIVRKNALNNLSWDTFKNNILGHLQYNKAIDEFLKDPINDVVLQDYFKVTQTIQKFYSQNRNEFVSIEDVFRAIFNRLTNDYDDGMNNQKIKIILHNMYFNCDIGDNPDA
jgi:hypothetical protein